MPRPGDIRLYFDTKNAREAERLFALHRYILGEPVTHVLKIV